MLRCAVSLWSADLAHLADGIRRVARDLTVRKTAARIWAAYQFGFIHEKGGMSMASMSKLSRVQGSAERHGLGIPPVRLG